MILEQKVLNGVKHGAITLAFRRWRRPTVRSGGTLLTAAGQLQIGSVTIIDPGAISDEEAVRAGYPSQNVLLADLDRRREGEVYRIEIGPLRPDPRIALRSTTVTESDVADLRRRLDRLDAASPHDAWTLRTLRAVRERPGVRAGDLCRTLGQEREPFKRNVRKLRNLGLTESLDVGYRLSPRGKLFLDQLEDRASTSDARHNAPAWKGTMDFDLITGTAVLERTPRTLRAMLTGLPPAWTDATEGPDTWSPYIIVGHLIHGERTDWIPRAGIILAQGPERRFTPYDRFAQFRESRGKSLTDLLDEFDRLRGENLATLAGWRLGEAQLALEGEHPEFGSVTLRQLLATWVAHDLGHMAQTARVMAKQYREAVGPWRAYLPVMDR